MSMPEAAQPAPPPGQLISVPSKFAADAGRPGGVKRDVGLQRAEATLISAHAEIRHELDTAFEATLRLAGNLQQVEDPDFSELDRLRKSARQMRDVGTLAHYPLVTLIGAMLVDTLNRQLTGEYRHRPEALAVFADALVLAKSQKMRDAGPQDAPQLMSDLNRMMTSLAE